MRPLVEFCQSNLASYSQKVMEALENDPDLDVDVIDYGCLGYCGECFQGPYALVDGEFVAAQTAEELLAKIKEYVKKNEA
ncbi:YuzB family protein [Bacillaceae bacterium]